MNFISGIDAGHRLVMQQSGYPSRNTMSLSSPSEEWDNDEDFDLSSVSGNALELPRSDVGSDDHITVGEEGLGTVKGTTLDRGEDAEDWDAELADDEDQGDTIKVSSIANSTLSQLAALRKNNSNVINVSGHPSLEPLNGTVKRLGAYKLVPHRVDIEGGGDWDEDLEVPDTFPTLRPLHSISGFASDLDFETPSVGSTSDATTSGSLPSDSRQRSLTQSSFLSSRREQRSSTSSMSSSSFASSPRRTKIDLPNVNHPRVNPPVKEVPKENEEEDFELPAEVIKLILSPSIGRQRSNPTIEQQQSLWGEDGKRSSSPGRASLSENSTKESDAEEDNILDGIDFPDQLFARSKADAPNAMAQLQAKLDARKKPLDGQESSSSGSKWIGGSREGEFSQGLIITDDLDLSPSRLKAKKLSNRIREAAHQRRRSRDIKNFKSQLPIAGAEATDRATPSSSRYDRDLVSRKSEISSYTPAARPGWASPSLGGDGATTKVVASSSRLLASTAASRAREMPPRCASPRQSPHLEGGRWERRTPTPIQEVVATTSRRAMTGPQRVNSGPSSEKTSPGISNIESSTPSKAGTLLHRGSATRYTTATASSRARQADTSRASTLSPVSSPVVTRVMKGPKRARAYDGKELDSIDDLPMSRDKTDRPTITRVLKGVPLLKKDAAQSPAPNVNNATGCSLTITQPTRGKNRQSKRKQPMLIRNLGGSNAAPRVEGDMKWNPRLQRWEGNEEEARSFENAVKGSGRPALITQLSVVSTNVVLGPTSTRKGGGVGVDNPVVAPIIVQADPTSPPAVGARIVGDMIFDPIRLRWNNRNEEEEDDPFAFMKDDETEEEDNDDEKLWLSSRGDPSSSSSIMLGVPPIENNRIKNHHSSASLRLRSDTDADASSTSDEWTEATISRLLRGPKKQVPDNLAHRISPTLWLQCLEAKKKHDEEVANFMPKKDLPHSSKRRIAALTPARDRNSHLYMIQTLARKAMPD